MPEVGVKLIPKAPFIVVTELSSKLSVGIVGAFVVVPYIVFVWRKINQRDDMIFFVASVPNNVMAVELGNVQFVNIPDEGVPNAPPETK